MNTDDESEMVIAVIMPVFLVRQFTPTVISSYTTLYTTYDDTRLSTRMDVLRMKHFLAESRIEIFIGKVKG